MTDPHNLSLEEARERLGRAYEALDPDAVRIHIQRLGASLALAEELSHDPDFMALAELDPLEAQRAIVQRIDNEQREDG